MAIKPRSRKHEDRLLKLEVDLTNMQNELRFVCNMAVLTSTPPKQSFWQRLNAYLSR